ncbi:MAG: hypothetical protein MK186_13180 [Henriciella sp.]|nr:hypothetical protein [Henriciella sp.]
MDTQDTDQEFQQDEPVSIRDSLEAALTEQASEEGAAPAPTDDTSGDEVSPASPAGDRPRDEHGKFTKKPEEQKPEATPNEGAEPGKESGEADKPAETDHAGPPSSWNAEGRDLFAKADPKLQEYIRTREGQMHEGIAKLKNEYEGKATFAEEMWREIAPHKHLIDKEGGNPVLAVRDLLGMAALMRTGTHEQKRQLLLSTAQQFGVDLSGTQANPQEAPQVLHDPRVDTLEQTLRQMAAQNEQQTRQQLQSDVEKFAQSHPHFDDVRVEMGRLIEAGIAKDMDDAYERAIWSVPDVRQKVQAEAAEKTAKEREAKAREQAEKAKRASGSVTGAPGMAGSGQAVAPASTLREEIERNAQALRA